MFRSRRPHVAPPDPALVSLVETTGAAARLARRTHDAIALVLRDVADTAGWRAGHAWVATAEPGGWRSARLWFPDDGLALGELRTACFAAPGPPAAHLAAALRHGAALWTGDLSGLAGSPLHDAAAGAGVTATVACPVYVAGRPVALLEWYLPDARRPSGDVTYALGHLSAVLSDVAERELVHAVPEQGTLRAGSALAGR